MENSSDYYYEQMKKSETPGRSIAAMYCVLYDLPVTKKEIIMCNKLVGYFGRYITFHAIIDMKGSYPDAQEEPLPLLYTICKKRFERSHQEDTLQSRVSLDGYAEEMKKEIERVKRQKPKIPPAEGLDGND